MTENHTQYPGFQPPHLPRTDDVTQELPSYSERTYQTAQAFPTKPRKKSSVLAGVAALALLAVGGGGAAGVATTLAMNNGSGTGPWPTSVTQVVQTNEAAPDWSATAAAVSPAVVAIQVAGQGGASEGSGVILDSDGNIVTNNHVVAGSGRGSEVRVMIGTRSYVAETVGTDPSTDLAVIRLVDPPSDLVSITFGDSSEVKVGQPVMAIGNPLGLSDTVTTGIVSALDRPVTTREVSDTVGESGSGTVVTNAIQTSAAINPGNSGGALVNANGELVGITSSIATLTSSASSPSGNIGIGFAIPADHVRSIVDQLLTEGVATHPQLGVNARDTAESGQLGAEIVNVVPGSAAEEAGLRDGDVVIAVDDRAVTSSESLVALIRSSEVGQKVEVKVLRGGAETTVDVTLRAQS